MTIQYKYIYCQADRGCDDMLHPLLCFSPLPCFSSLSWLMQNLCLPLTCNINVLIVRLTWEVLTCSFPVHLSLPSHCLSKSFDCHWHTIFNQCSEKIKCLLFKFYCTGFYSSPLWITHSSEPLRRILVAFNRIFRILLNLESRQCMSSAYVPRGLNPYTFVIHKFIFSFKQFYETHIHQNIYVEIILLKQAPTI